jgi:hypothetical protein
VLRVWSDCAAVYPAIVVLTSRIPHRPQPNSWFFSKSGLKCAFAKGIPPQYRPDQVVLSYDHAERRFVCEAFDLEYEISTEGIATHASACQLVDDSLTTTISVR